MRRGEAQLAFKNIVASMNLWQSMAIRLVASPTATRADYQREGEVRPVISCLEALDSRRLFL